MNGAQLWETAIMVPAWTKAPPASLVFFQEPYPLDFKQFWIITHSIHELIFIIAIVTNWRVKQRKFKLLLLFIAHFAIRAWTLLYFAPAIDQFREVPFSGAVDQLLVEKAAGWRNWNYLRVSLFFMLNMLMIPLFKYNSNDRG
ncbi:transposase [Chitinophaga lutea]|uniref:Transposase n=2 Tax=Chitinophaga lutea TaxID=2488634 RepID=A0A3N4PQD3_9BACT|nr:transposase [Chitinophaga lutea]